MQIYVKMLTGNTLAIDVENLTTVSELKKLIEGKEGFPAESQRLIFAGQIMKDTEIVGRRWVNDGEGERIEGYDLAREGTCILN
jgi:hypothetical protein